MDYFDESSWRRLMEEADNVGMYTYETHLTDDEIEELGILTCASRQRHLTYEEHDRLKDLEQRR